MIRSGKPILFVIGSLDVGGAETHLVQVLPRLRAKGFQPVVYTLVRKGALAGELEQHEIPVYAPWGSTALSGLPRPIRLVVTFITSPLALLWHMWKGATVVHTFLPAAYLVGGLLSFAAPLRARVMSRRSLNLYQEKHPWLSRIEYWMHPRMSAVLGNSRAVVEDLRMEGVSAGHLRLLYNGLDEKRFLDLPSKHSARTKLGLNEESLVLVSVANLIPYKGHRDILEALAQIGGNLPSAWTLILVGRDDGIGAGLRSYAESVGIDQHILWLGQRTDALAVMRAADIGVLASHQEGFSNSVLEGMAIGLAMVVTDVGGNREAIGEEKCGIVVPPRNPKALADAISSLAVDADLRVSIGLHASQRIMSRFSMERCVSGYACLYDALLEGQELPGEPGGELIEGGDDAALCEC